MLIGGFLGLVIGGILGFTGAGGGIFAVPALVFGLDIDIREAAPIALLAVGVAAALGALQGLHHGIVRYKAATVLAAAGSLAAPLGFKLASWLPPSWLNLIFVLVMLMVGYRMLMASRRSGEDMMVRLKNPAVCKVSTETGRFIWEVRTAITLAGIGAVAGLFNGMLGVSGGFVIVPALAHFSELRMHSIVATSLMVIALLSTVTVFMAGTQGFSLTPETWAFAAFAALGMVAARLFAAKIPSMALQRIFGTACLVVAAMMFMRDIG